MHIIFLDYFYILIIIKTRIFFNRDIFSKKKALRNPVLNNALQTMILKILYYKGNTCKVTYAKLTILHPNNLLRLFIIIITRV